MQKRRSCLQPETTKVKSEALCSKDCIDLSSQQNRESWEARP